MAEKQLLAEKMRELSASANFRKCIKEMNALQRAFSNRRFVHITNPDEQTLEMLRAEGFTCTQTKITEYVQYRILW